jgi:hypothetical protein
VEFDAFPASGIPAHPKVAWMVVAFPAPRVIPFEEFPSSAAAPHHCGRCLLAFTARSPRPDLPDPGVGFRLPSRGRSCCSGAEHLRGPKPSPCCAVAGRSLPRRHAPSGRSHRGRWAARGLRRLRLAHIASEEDREPVRTATTDWPSAEPRGARSASPDRGRGWRPPATVVARWRRRAGALPW